MTCEGGGRGEAWSFSPTLACAHLCGGLALAVSPPRIPPSLRRRGPGWPLLPAHLTRAGVCSVPGLSPRRLHGRLSSAIGTGPLYRAAEATASAMVWGTASALSKSPLRGLWLARRIASVYVRGEHMHILPLHNPRPPRTESPFLPASPLVKVKVSCVLQGPEARQGLGRG